MARYQVARGLLRVGRPESPGGGSPPVNERAGPGGGAILVALLIGLALALGAVAAKAVLDARDAQRELRVLAARIGQLEANDRRQQAESRRLRQALRAGEAASAPMLAADGSMQWATTQYRDVFNGVPNPVLMVGYNAMPAITGATRIDEYRHAYAQTWEGDYFDGKEHWSEWNIAATTAKGIARRIFGSAFNWNTESASWNWAGGLFTLGKETTFDVHLQFDLRKADDRAVHHRFAGGGGEFFQVGHETPDAFPDFYMVGSRAYVDFAKGFALYRDGQFALGADPSAAGGAGPMLVLGTPSQAPQRGPALYVDPADGMLKFIDGGGARHALY